MPARSGATAGAGRIRLTFIYRSRAARFGYDAADVERPLRLDLEGEALLAIPAGPRHNQYSLAQLGAVAKSDGWIVSGFGAGHSPTVGIWRFTGYRHHRDQVYVVGSWVDGVTLDAALAAPPSPARSRRLHRLALALEALAKRVGFTGPIQGDAVIFTDDDRVLLLPPAVMERLNGVKTPAERLASVDRYRHPHRTGPQQLAFALGVAVYRALCGRYPFDGASEEEVHDRVRGLQLVPPRTFQPSAPAELSDAVAASLGQDAQAVPALSAWGALLGGRAAAGALAEIGDPPPAALTAAEAEAEQAERRYARSRFLHRNWRRLAGWGAGAAVALAILVPIIGRALAPPVTRGLEPAEVVELFYDSINTLDTEPMEDAVTGDAGRALINETLHMFLESRMAMAGRGPRRVVPAPEWDAMGRPAAPPFRVYGITDLEVVTEQAGAEPVFAVRYYFWTPNVEDMIVAVRPPGLAVTERVRLRWNGKDWAIEALESLRREAAPADAVPAAGTAADGSEADGSPAAGGGGGTSN